MNPPLNLVPAPAGGLRAQLAARLRLLRSFTDFLPTGSGSKPQASAPPTETHTETPTEPPTETLSAIWADLDGCTRCRLSEKRQNIVFGVGRPDADLMFIGEGPGGEEDRQGEPFVGPAGEQLNEMIEKCFRRRRSDVYIANIVKCRPPRNRNPRSDEVATCLPFLERQIASIRPRVICLLGSVAVKALFPGVGGITAARGTVYEFAGIPVVPIFHPAYLLRSEGERLQELKRQVLDDARIALEILERPPAPASPAS